MIGLLEAFFELNPSSGLFNDSPLSYINQDCCIMCTLSWQISADQNELNVFFNRDELFARPQAVPPGVYQDQESAARFLAPIDPQGGGTWMALNEQGLILCLLNDYEGKSMANLSDRAKSRGLLVRRLAGLKSAGEITRQMTLEEVKVFQPFNLVLFDGVQHPVMWRWNGEKLVFVEHPTMPLVSSGYSQREVQKKRSAIFENEMKLSGRVLTPEQLLFIHQSEAPLPQPNSIAMALEDRGTVSITRAQLIMQAGQPNSMRMYYWPGNPVKGSAAMVKESLEKKDVPVAKKA